MTIGERNPYRSEGAGKQLPVRPGGPANSDVPDDYRGSSNGEIRSGGSLPADPLFELLDRMDQGHARDEPPPSEASKERGKLIMVESTPERLELRHYVDILRRRWAWFLFPVLLMTALAALLNLQSTETYSSSARVLINASDAGQVLGGAAFNVQVSAREVENEIAFANSDVVRSMASEGLDDLDVSASVAGSEEADLLEFTAVATDPLAAADAANAWAAAFVRAKQERAIDSTQELTQSFRTRLAELSEERRTLTSGIDRIEDGLALTNDPERLAELGRERDRENRRIAFEEALIDAEVSAITVGITELQINGQLVAAGEYQIIQVAAPASSPLNLPLPQSLAFGVIAGVILGTGAAFLRNSLDQKIKSHEDIQAMGLNVLGSVPRPDRPLRKLMDRILFEHPESRTADGYLEVRAGLQFVSTGKDIKSVFVTSANEGDGKTTTAANLALALAHVDQLVVLADVDLRRPRLHEIYGFSRSPGIVDLVEYGVAIEDLVHQSDMSHNLHLISAGSRTQRVADVFGNDSFLNTLMRLEKEVDIVILDGPPVLPVSDAQRIANAVDATILCVRVGKTRRSEVAAAVEKLGRSGANMIGVVVTDAPDRRASYDYHEAD